MAEITFSKIADNVITNQYSGKQNAPPSNINVVISNSKIGKSSNVNINNNILVINKFNKEEEKKSNAEKSENHVYDIEDLNSPKGRIDRKGNEILKNRKNHKVTFIDKVTKKRLVEIVDIESFKQYNITEEISDDKGKSRNSCCMTF